MSAGACLVPDALFHPQISEWRRYLMHAFWPTEASYLRGALTTTAIVVQGYALEYELGTAHFAWLVLMTHFVCCAILLYFRFTICCVSLEPALASLAVLAHRTNPKIYTNGLDVAVRLPFAIEPRWHLWILQSMLVLSAADFPMALVSFVTGLTVGALGVLRDPQTWGDAWAAARRRSAHIGLALHLVAFFFVLLFVPLTAQESVFTLVITNLPDGQPLKLSWWRSLPASPPLLHFAIAGGLGGEALFITKLLIAVACPLVLSPLLMWAKVYAAACVLLAMYVMNSAAWGYVHVGFLSLFYFAGAFWNFPAAVARERRAD